MKRWVMLVVLSGALWAGSGLGGPAPASAARSTAGLTLALQDVGRRPVAGDSRYLYVGPRFADGRVATVWDSRTGRREAITLPPTCGQSAPVLGSGVAFFICGTGYRETGWAYAISSRNWTQVADSVVSGYCDDGSGPCTPSAAGTHWVGFDSPPPGCDQFQCGTDGTEVFYDLRTHAAQTMDDSGEGAQPCFKLQGCLDLDHPALRLTSSARACAPLPLWDFTPLSDGWVALNPFESLTNPLAVQRCGSTHRILLSVNPNSFLTGGSLLFWVPNTYTTVFARVFSASLQRTFSLRITGISDPYQFIPEGITGDEVYGVGASVEANYVARLPAAVTATPWTGGRP
jgi:hypothetical protein